ncbi:MAG: acyloxyacyl hydrolase [Acidithiobacillus ferriphilus]|uniref:Deacylase n=2 Tax=Acidithiobacillus TaxID=119977 RepID=A0A257TD94_9PROT|nr:MULTISPECIES: acyloxyacyl hydrolase [Acidithiobacillus]OYV82496.1 MAG: deacylase [Acidithiobacillus ferrivorans]MBU2828501.1 acyloxyacyl hydrolase [Acidithiobacillus ferriphilus]MBU2846005.1 acyloxyacyl hydrolase [Acidithiobacillus ferriphilus]MDA8245576.1 acyloxyacyl hydrolase [Acidithiobacillus sp.]MEB8475909.1 acyloxyacyl hydrolase [Acidithiobacillus ferriphilus]
MKQDMRVWVGIMGSAALGVLVTGSAQAGDTGLHVIQGGPAYFSAGIGAFNAAGVKPGPGHRGNATLPELDLEYQSASKLFGIGALWGIVANTNGGFMGYTGLYSDVAWNHWVLTPVLGIGGYNRGRGKYLDGVFQFRLELSLAYQFANQSRFGLKIAHISNAYIAQEDPGEDEIMLDYSIPLSFGDHSS